MEGLGWRLSSLTGISIRYKVKYVQTYVKNGGALWADGNRKPFDLRSVILCHYRGEGEDIHHLMLYMAQVGAALLEVMGVAVWKMKIVEWLMYCTDLYHLYYTFRSCICLC